MHTLTKKASRTTDTSVDETVRRKTPSARTRTHLADLYVHEVVEGIDVLAHETPELQKVRQQLPFPLDFGHPLMPVIIHQSFASILRPSSFPTEDI